MNNCKNCANSINNNPNMDGVNLKEICAECQIGIEYAKNMKYKDAIWKLIDSCNRKHNTPDLHSFVADIKGGTVFVDCRGFEVHVQSTVFDGNQDKTENWTGTAMAAGNRLALLGIDLLSVEI